MSACSGGIFYALTRSVYKRYPSDWVIVRLRGNYTETSTAALNIEIGGLTSGSQFDRPAISGVATLSKALNISLIGGFVPNPGDSFPIMTFASRSGTFTTTNAPGFAVNVNAANVTAAAP